MDIESLFTVSKWEILSHLSLGKLSPLELSRKLNTSMANVSQQLRLLEFAGIVKKEKVSAREAGKPRTLYFLADDFCDLVLLSKNFARKRLLRLTEYHKIVLKIWMIEDVSSHYFLEKFFWKIEHLVEQTKAIAVETKGSDITVYLVTDSKDLEKKVQDIQLKNVQGQTKSISVKVILEKELFKLSKQELNVIHDPEGIMLTKKGEV
ncbi:MAG: helix-turn-helix domain-containing protein [Candidatus Woesearchaeota archaeon]